MEILGWTRIKGKNNDDWCYDPSLWNGLLKTRIYVEYVWWCNSWSLCFGRILMLLIRHMLYGWVKLGSWMFKRRWTLIANGYLDASLAL